MNKHRLRGTRSILMGLALLLFVLGLSSAQSVTAAKGAVSWTGSFSSDWHDPFNWDAFQVPNSSNAVFIGPAFNAPVISSDVEISSLTLEGGELTLNSGNLLTLNSHIFLNGILNSNGNLIVGGNLTNNGTYNAGSSSGVTLYGSAPQTLGGSSVTTFRFLTINNSSGVTLNQDQTVEHILYLGNGRLSLGSSNLILGQAASVINGDSASTMVVADGSGEMRKRFAGPGSFTFPVGTSTDGADYSPMTINVTDGEFTGNPYVGVRVIDAVHSAINVSNYLSRFWTSSSNFSTVTADVTLNYLDNDVVGDENIYKAQLFNNGNWQQASSTTVNAGANQITGTAFNSLSGDFSAGTFPLPVQLHSFDATSADKYVLLNWQTTMELNNLGFNLYRGIEGSRAPTIKINDELIPSQAPGSGQGAYYEYRDYSVVEGLGRPYLYWLEDVDVNGNKTLHGPVSVTFGQ